MIPIAFPLIGAEEKEAVLETLSSGQLAQGAKVQEFEERFAAWTGARYAVAVSSGTAALHLALLAHGIGSGDIVVTSPFSFIASASSIVHAGARPRFVDIEPAYYTIDPDLVALQITPRVRAIIPVHIFGQPCDMEAILEIAERRGLIVIQDACQAHGARLHGRSLAAFGTACYSFYPTKNMTTGEGGMVTTDDSEVADRLRKLRNHGMRKRYVHEMIGYNMRMTDLQAAIGLVQLGKLAAWNEQRQANADYLTLRLSQAPAIEVPEVRPGAEHVFHQYTVRVRWRAQVAQELERAGIGVGIYYPIPIHRQQPFADLCADSFLPVAEACCESVLSLPVHPALSQHDLDTIADTLIQVVSSYEKPWLQVK